jgi:hypothetical protein
MRASAHAGVSDELVFSLVFHSAVHITGRQLLFSGAAAWFTDAIAFALAFWELDCGGPVAVPSRQRLASLTSSLPKMRTPNSHGKVGRHACGITSTCR